MPSDLTTAIDLYKYAESTVNSLWALYSGVALALLGYILGSKTPVPGRAKIGLAAIFFIFAMANLHSLCQAQSLGYAAALSIDDLSHTQASAGSLAMLIGKLRVSSPRSVVTFQSFLTLSALAAIWAAHRHDNYLRTHPESATTRSVESH